MKCVKCVKCVHFSEINFRALVLSSSKVFQSKDQLSWSDSGQYLDGARLRALEIHNGSRSGFTNIWMLIPVNKAVTSHGVASHPWPFNEQLRCDITLRWKFQSDFESLIPICGTMWKGQISQNSLTKSLIFSNNWDLSICMVQYGTMLILLFLWN